MTTGSELDRRAESERAFFADWTVHPFGDELRWRRELDLLRRKRPDGLGDVLSLGCGRGWFELLLSEHAESVLGIDLSPESIEAARARAARECNSKVAFECVDVADLSLDRSFHTVVCVGFLHHLTDSEGLALLRRIHDHLRPGGLVHTQDPNARGILRALGRRVLGRRYDAYHTEDERELVPETVRRLFVEAGFRSAEISYMDFSLIPGMQLFPKAPRLLMSAFDRIDHVFCWLPTAPFASGFAVDAVR
jgi:SAM-dependent methyltransferase